MAAMHHVQALFNVLSLRDRRRHHDRHRPQRLPLAGSDTQTAGLFSDHCDKTGNHMGIPLEELVDTCEWMVEEVEDDYRGVDIPLDQARRQVYVYH